MSTRTKSADVKVARKVLTVARERSKLEQSAIDGFKLYMAKLKEGELWLPVKKWGGSITSSPLPMEPQPSLFLVEFYGISSFLGDYGMGRTVKTLTLLPGEETTITMRTWKATKETIAQGSSIVDSHHESAKEQFAESVQSETTDKTTETKDTSWYVDAEANASWGWGSASVSGGGSGQNHTGREQFAKQVEDTTKEQSNEASSSREVSVTSSSEKSEETGEETATERVIRNVNMRRTLNFVFRELNQEFITKTHLKDVRVAFSNGLLDSWTEVPLSGLRGLLLDLLQPSKVDAVSQDLLKLTGTVSDINDNPVSVLETVTMSANGQSWSIRNAAVNRGAYPPPTDNMFYRFKRGPLAQGKDPNPVDGVLLKEGSIVMRTDSVAVEALLGQADALDDYAMEVQKAAAEAKTLANEREKIAQEVLRLITDPVKKAEAYAAMFGTQETEEE